MNDELTQSHIEHLADKHLQKIAQSEEKALRAAEERVKEAKGEYEKRVAESDKIRARLDVVRNEQFARRKKTLNIDALPLEERWKLWQNNGVSKKKYGLCPVIAPPGKPDFWANRFFRENEYYLGHELTASELKEIIETNPESFGPEYLEEIMLMDLGSCES